MTSSNTRTNTPQAPPLLLRVKSVYGLASMTHEESFHLVSLAMQKTSMAVWPEAIPGGSGGAGCCKKCSAGKPCGNTCISAEATCTITCGCACSGEETAPAKPCAFTEAEGAEFSAELLTQMFFHANQPAGVKTIVVTFDCPWTMYLGADEAANKAVYTTGACKPEHDGWRAPACQTLLKHAVLKDQHLGAAKILSVEPLNDFMVRVVKDEAGGVKSSSTDLLDQLGGA